MTKDLVRSEEVRDGINVIIDSRFVAMFPMESKAQVDHLVESVNLAFRQHRKAKQAAQMFTID